MSDNGIYSDGYQDGRHAMIDEIAELYNSCDDAAELAAELESILHAEGAL